MQNSKNCNPIFIKQSFHLEALPHVVKTIIMPLLKTHAIVTLIGPLGAGKTTLVREISRQIGIQEPITSPTFGYFKRYQTLNNQIINHFDLYRIDSAESFIANGFDEYLYQKKTITFIEWPKIIEPLLITQKTLGIHLEFDPKDTLTRNIIIKSSTQP